MSIKIQEQLSVSDLLNNTETKKILRAPLVEWKGTKAHLAPKERDVWLLLHYGRGFIIPYEQLEACMYRKNATRSKKESQHSILRVIICGIRRKLKANIVPIAKIGYVLDPEEG